MSEQKSIKEQMMEMHVQEVELLLSIIGDLGFIGYKVAMCRLKGKSLQTCAIKLSITKEAARWSWKKCKAKRYDEKLKALFNLNPST